MKRLHLSFLAAELGDFDTESVLLEDVTVDLCHANTHEGSTVWLEDFRACGEPMKQWVIDHSYDDILNLILSEIDYTAHFDGEIIKVGGGKYKVGLIFGNPSQSYDVFSFDTQRELDCFMEGVEAMNGWSKAMLPEDAEEEDLESLELESPEDYECLQRDLSAAKEVDDAEPE